MQILKGINVVSIAVPDLGQARAFYSEVLGLGTPTYDLPEAGWIEFNAGSPAGEIALTPAKAGWEPSDNVTIVFNVEDCHGACQALRARGVRCDDPVGIPGMVTYANVYDPFGNRLQVCSAPPPA